MFKDVYLTRERNGKGTKNYLRQSLSFINFYVKNKRFDQAIRLALERLEEIQENGTQLWKAEHKGILRCLMIAYLGKNRMNDFYSLYHEYKKHRTEEIKNDGRDFNEVKSLV